MSEKLGGPRVFVKRDDQTGLAFGGNKTRKLEFLIAEAQQLGAGSLISAGSIQSNHCRQTAAAAARFGFQCTLVLTGEMPKHPSANILLDPNGHEPSFENVLGTVYDSGFRGDVYPAPWMWDAAPKGVFPRYPFPDSFKHMCEGGF